MKTVPVIKLVDAPGEGSSWDRPKMVVYLWGLCEWLFVTNALQVSSSLRIKVLRAFGAVIGEGVIFRPRTRVRFPWKLHIGNGCWIGEGVWFHNQDHIYVGNDVVISQETMLTTGSHRHRKDMGLVTSPIHIESGAWVTSRCMILGGVTIGKSSLVKPMNRVDRDVDAGMIWDGGRAIGDRFKS